MSGQNKNVSRKNIILSLAPTKSYDQIQATLNLLFVNDLKTFDLSTLSDYTQSKVLIAINLCS